MAEPEFIAGTKKTKNNSLFNNKLFIFGISLLCSLIIWSVISMYETPEKDRVFQDVKVQMSLTDTVPGTYDLKLFGDNEFFCDVTVTGKSYLVNDTTFTSDKIVVKPELEEIREPGVYEVHLQAQLVNAASDLSVTSVEPEYVTVYLDTAEEKEFPLKNNVSEEYEVADGYEVTSMEMKTETVTVVAPSLEMQDIKEVRASVVFVDALSKTIQMPCDIEFITDGKKVQYATVKDVENIHLDISVSVWKSFTMSLDFVNCPAEIEPESIFTYTFRNINEEAELLIPTDNAELMNTDRIAVGSVDFRELTLSSQQDYTVLRADNPVLEEDLPEMLEVTLRMDTAAWTEQTYTVPVEYDAGKYANLTVDATVADVTLIMPKADAESFAVAELRAKPLDTDLQKLVDGVNTVPVQIVLPDAAKSTWCSGSYAITVTRNTATSAAAAGE